MRRAGPASGFTLIELCFVVGIIGILAAIAIPNFVVYQHQAKATEATIALETIAYLEQVAILETGETIACEAQPAVVPKGTREPFVASDAWKDLGFEMTAKVRYQYEVRKTGPDGFLAFARGDLDGDGKMSEFEIDSATMQLKRRDPTE